jgi:hypothetical protein
MALGGAQGQEDKGWGLKAKNGMGSGGPPVLWVSPDHGAACLVDSDVRRTRNESTGGGASLAAKSWRLSPTTGGLPCDPGGNSTRSRFYGCHYSSHLI